MTTRNTSSASLLEKDLEIVGNISFQNNLYVHGKVNGNIIAPVDSRASLYIQGDSEVTGEIRAPLVVVSGKISGDVFVSRRISLKSTAQVNGNIHYMEIQMDEGAEVNGVLVSMNNTPNTQ
ncbi:bactofilin family protein [Thiothrix lacustris]|uniref:Polymer-forming cytoskeletal protein n=1 Tax=Thiothrix lacustris TaxID=525917 RepID=A0ABY9MVV2_9GAMM|nr:polymer-forming cytoskeletal protein [Thiothrix lacustris]WML92391.1 polymer-forming cytoskeletal protein [Thiothrix lacustris]WMP15688.1 polymer-forming cytoskeletal protein [Thiothrix lacustris]